MRHSWGGDSVSGKVGTRSKVVELVLAWVDAREPMASLRAVNALHDHLADPGAVIEYDTAARRATVTLSPGAFTRLHNREFRRPYRPAPSSFIVALGEGRLVDFVSRKEAHPYPGPEQYCSCAAGVTRKANEAEDAHDPAKAWVEESSKKTFAGVLNGVEYFRLPAEAAPVHIVHHGVKRVMVPYERPAPPSADNTRARDAALGGDYNGVGAVVLVGEE